MYSIKKLVVDNIEVKGNREEWLISKMANKIPEKDGLDSLCAKTFVINDKPDCPSYKVVGGMSRVGGDIDKVLLTVEVTKLNLMAMSRIELIVYEAIGTFSAEHSKVVILKQQAQRTLIKQIYEFAFESFIDSRKTIDDGATYKHPTFDDWMNAKVS